MYQMMLSGGCTSDCELMLTWLKSVNLFRASVVVRNTSSCQSGPIKLPPDYYSQILSANYPLGSFFRNQNGSIPQTCIFDGRKKYMWAFNPTFETKFGVSAEDFDSQTLMYMSMGYSSISCFLPSNPIFQNNASGFNKICGCSVLSVHVLP
jgi:hypothetical protein